MFSAIAALGFEVGGDCYWCVGPLKSDQCSLDTILKEAGLGDNLAGALRWVPHRTFNAMVPDQDFDCESPVLHMPGCREEACADNLLQKCPLA